MKKTNEKSMTVREVIEALKGFEADPNFGPDAEVVLVNNEEKVFDGVGKMFGMMSQDKETKAVAIMRGNVVLKI